MTSQESPPGNHHQIVHSFIKETLIFNKVLYFIKTNLP